MSNLTLVRFNKVLIIDENGNIKSEIPVDLEPDEILELKRGRLPDKIKNIIGDDTVFLNQKFENYKRIDDVKLLRKVLRNLHEENILEYYDTLLKATIRDISNSITRDLIVIQAVYMLDDLNRIINLFMERFREWYELYLPEVSKKIEDHEKFIREVCCKSREELMKKYNIDLTMGGSFTSKDVEMLNDLAKNIRNLYELREKLRQYIDRLMEEVAPNVKRVAGPVIGARLIALAGGLKELASLPSSTIQVLGAEKALFRHLRKGTPPPKHGVLFNHPMIQKLPRKYRGAMARTLASKISIAAKVDTYTPGKDVSKYLIKQIEERYSKLLEKSK